MPKKNPPKTAYLLMIGQIGCIPDFRMPDKSRDRLIKEAKNWFGDDNGTEATRGMTACLAAGDPFYPTVRPYRNIVVQIALMSETDKADWWNAAKGEWNSD